jgi:hypothetical protein
VILLDVARSARVPASNQMRFVRLVQFAIIGAHRESGLPVGKRISAGALTRDFFDPIARSAKTLRMELERLQGENLAAGEAARSTAAAHHFGDGLRALPGRSGSAILAVTGPTSGNARVPIGCERDGPRADIRS